MKTVFKSLLLIAIFAILFVSCQKEITPPVLQSSPPTSVTSNGASGTVTVVSTGGAEITDRGICWANTTSPSLINNVVRYGTGSGSFSWSLSGLSPGTQYFVRSFATNKAGTNYGAEISFYTEATTASLTTSSVTSITANGAVGGGNISSNGGSAITARGVCWSTSQNPLISGLKTTDGNDIGVFTSNLTGLLPGTTYYVRAYVTNGVGTSYGNELNFRTLATVPTVTTTDISQITSSGAQSGGAISDDGGGTITSKGVCWSTNQNPTVSDSKTSDTDFANFNSSPFTASNSESNKINANAPGSSYISTITGLLPGITYYVRAFAVNSAGTSYGSQKSFTTTVQLAAITTSAATSLTSNSAVSGGSVSNDGGSIVTSRGVCWSNSQNPTTLNNKTTDGSGTGNFTSNIGSLDPGTTYYLRAYAINGAGTSYGNQIIFTTLATLPVISTASVTDISATGAISGGNITNNGGANVSSRGVCWSTSQNPTTANSKTSDGSGTGSYASTLSGLSPGVIYYVRAYAVNSVGTVYGNQISFTSGLVTPTVTTGAITSITSTTAFGGGNVTDGGGATVTTRGICWSISQNPTISNNKSTNGSGTGSFTSSITGLEPGTTYYVRAYATNSAGTSYGSQMIFTTTAVVPTVTTTSISGVTSTGALSGGTVTSDGGASVTARGVCWSISQNPTTSNSKTSDGSGTGSYTSTITGLTPGVTYYLRAYATNSEGTAYGSQLILNTSAVAPTVTTAAITSITSTTASGGGNVTDGGGATVTARGICWSTSQNPTISNSKSTDGTETGSFTSSITGLEPGTTYYVRAYATNSAGTSYGSQMIFATTSIAPTVSTLAISSITSSSASGGGNITVSGGITISEKGVCWSTSQNPTISNSKTTDGTGSGVFSSSITGLTQATLYYVRAYATYSGGTVYGSQVSFTTHANIPTITTTATSSITSTTVRSGGNVSADGGATVSARGVCWSTSQNPTISNSKTTNSTGTGSFTSYVTGLTPSTTYYLRAYATNSAGTAYGSQVSFTAGAAADFYEDGEYKTYQTNTSGTNPCEVLVLGDGYQSTDYAAGGLFDQNADEGIEAFLGVEPYITYRNYFKVYKMASFSEDSGVTQTDLSITKNTVFNTQFTGGSSLTVDYAKVNTFALTLPGMTSDKLRSLLIIVIINQNRYAGTCWMWSDGKAIALCPVSRGTSTMTKYGAVVNHEAGGHGWGRLADEYINYTGQTISSSQVTTFNQWSGYGFYANVDLTNNLATIKWSHLVGLTGYDRVGAFEGAFYYSYGAWRAESTSCMINNIPYYSAPSREAIVKKIMSVSGGTYSLGNFISNDVQKAPTAQAALLTKSYNPLTFVPLAPPILLK